MVAIRLFRSDSDGVLAFMPGVSGVKAQPIVPGLILV